MEDLTGLGKLADSRVVNKAYDDLLTDAAQEGGKSLADLVKTFRLFTFPIQLLAVAQDRLARFCEDVRSRVPEERQIEATPSIAVPILLSLRHMEDENPRTALYLELLSRAIDRERVGEAHPAFPMLIDQMSSDEAIIMFTFAGGEEYRDHTESLIVPPGLLRQPEFLPIHMEHLKALNLIGHHGFAKLWRYVETGAGVSLGQVSLTAFGELFVRACIPDGVDPVEFVTRQ